MDPNVSRLLFAALVLVARLSAQGEEAPESRPERSGAGSDLSAIDRLVAPLIDARICVGAVVGVLREGRSEVRGYGKIRRGEDGVPGPDTVYEIGSITKVFTGMLFADAVTRRAVGLDDEVKDRLPAGRVLPNPFPAPVLLRHLATHTAGLPRLPVNLTTVADPDPYVKYDRDMLYAGLAGTELGSVPGACYAYSNLGAGLLGQILVDVQGAASYEALLRERICLPFRLVDTCVRTTGAATKRLAPPYDDAGRRRSSWNFDALVGCGGLRSTAADLLRFAALHLDPTSLEETARQMVLLCQERHHRASPVRSAAAGARPMGLGWHFRGGEEVLWHNGATGGYRSLLVVDKLRRVAVVVLANSTSPDVDVVGWQVWELIRGEGEDDGPTPLRIRAAIELEPEALAPFAGRYRLGKTVFDVRVVDGLLQARLGAQAALPLFPASTHRFFYRAVDAEIEFLEEEGRVKALVLIQDGRRMEAPRVR